METIIALLAVAAFLAAVVRLGTDSRDGNDWFLHSRP
jgi:hypothetical protein